MLWTHAEHIRGPIVGDLVRQGRIRQQPWVFFGAMGLLLLIACVNGSNLLLSKASSRAREMAVRSSPGATRATAIHQLLAEGLVLSLVGGLVGVALAFAGLKGMLAMVPAGTIRDEADVAINGPVLLFTLGLSFLATLLFGVAPAMHTAGQFEIAGVVRNTMNDIEHDRIVAELSMPYTVTGTPWWLMGTGPRAESLMDACLHRCMRSIRNNR